MGFKWNPLTGQLDLVSDAGSSQDALSAKTLILEKVASENISALKLVYLDTQASVALADNSAEATGTQYSAEIEGIFTATTSGLIYPQFRSETNGTQVRVNIDSNMIYKEY